jgi:hypothetical protein
MEVVSVDVNHNCRGGHKLTVIVVDVTITVEGFINGHLCWLMLRLLYGVINSVFDVYQW